MDSDQQWTTGKLLGVSSGYWRSCTVQAGVRLGIFSLLGREPLPAQEIVRKIEGESRGVEALLNALTSLGLLVKEGELYANTDFARERLDRASERYIGHIILHHHHLVDGWAQLHEAVLTGRPVETRSYGEEAERESFLLGMFNLAMGAAPGLAGQIDLAGRRHLLDLGGGPGTYAVHFCLNNPELRATIFDRPTTEPFARKITARFGVEDRIDFVGGDFTVDPIPGRYDVAWLSHILHSNGPETCAELVASVAEALEPGGLLMVHDFLLDDTMAAPQFPALFSLNMLINNPSGRSYSETEVGEMMARAGLKEIHRLEYTGANDAGIICGIRP